MSNKSYVLVTAARNEEKYIENTIKSVVSQSILPKKWLIVSDGSTDKTNEIVSSYLDDNKFMKLVVITGDTDRNFGSKANAIKLGYKELVDIDYDYIGNLDADISFDSSYYETIMHKLDHNKKLGIAGGVRFDLINGEFREVFYSKQSIAGAFQLFVRQCYEDIGGYMPLKFGGIDVVAELTARMHGWEVEAFPKVRAYHHRPTGSADCGVLYSRFRNGLRWHAIGCHPLFVVLRVFRRMTKSKSYVWGGPIEILGFFWATLCRYERPVSSEFVEFIRSEQFKRIKISSNLE